MSLPLSFRPAQQTDLGLIYNSWLKSYWDARPLVLEAVPRSLYFADEGHHGVIDRILARPNTRVIVAFGQEDPDEIYGWACAGSRALHYVYVKESWRRKKVAMRLLALVCEELNASSDPFRVTHMTRAFLETFCRSSKVVHDPYALMEA